MKTTFSLFAMIGIILVHAVAIPDADPWGGSKHWFCGIPGISCGKRSVDTTYEEMPTTAKFNNLMVGFCSVPGESCGKLQRSAEAVRDALSDHWANIDSPKTGASALCNAPGEDCHVAGEAIGDVSETAENAYHELLARNENPAKKSKCRSDKLPGGQTWFCGAPGQSCGKKRSEAYLTKRDDDSAAEMAETLSRADPGYLASECNKPGGECDSLRKAHAAFHQAKREAEAIQSLEDPEVKRAYCDMYSCGKDTRKYFRYLRSGSPEAKLIEQDCFAEDGECTLAQRSLDALESALERAVAKIA